MGNLKSKNKQIKTKFNKKIKNKIMMKNFKTKNISSKYK